MFPFLFEHSSASQAEQQAKFIRERAKFKKCPIVCVDHDNCCCFLGIRRSVARVRNLKRKLCAACNQNERQQGSHLSAGQWRCWHCCCYCNGSGGNQFKLVNAQSSRRLQWSGASVQPYVCMLALLNELSRSFLPTQSAGISCSTLPTLPRRERSLLEAQVWSKNYRPNT